MRKPRSDSAEAAIKAALNAATPAPQIPDSVKLSEKHLPFWNAIISSRARAEWSDATLIVAAQLARTQYEIEFESEALEKEGSVVENQRGTPIMNPRQTVMEQLCRREMALMRTLGISGSVANGDKRDLQKARKMQQQAEKLAKELEEDDLLA
jgi:hypothetical protein